MKKMTRRGMLGGTLAAGAMLAGAGAGTSEAHCPKCSTEVPKLTNDMFYKDGEFQAEAALEAYYAMFRRFGEPINDGMKELIWTLDFGLGDFVNCGMAGIFWWNSEEYSYFGHSIYLLPGQMIPEHAHVATDKGPAKMEAWRCIYGSVHNYGEGEEMPEMVARVPESQQACLQSKSALPLMPGEVRELNRLTAWHFMMAGPEGAIVEEYATFHDGDGLRFSNPKATLG